MSNFIHLHNHTHYSLLDGACKIEDLIETAQVYNMDSIAMTDHGNMFGAIQFYQKTLKAGLKPIIGIEAYMAPKSRTDRNKLRNEENAYHLILLARDVEGYKNLMTLSSIGYTEGFYYKPRIDRYVLKEHAQGLVCLSACIQGEVPYKIIHNDYEGAKEAALFYQELFGDNFYLEIQDHGIPQETTAIEGLKVLSDELNIPLVATNDTHYLKKEHAESQDILLCIQTGKDLDDPKRLKFSSNEMYFKSEEEMRNTLPEFPQSIDITKEIAEKCNLVLDFKARHFPTFAIPEDEDVFTLDDYLEKKVYEGAKKRYSEITNEIRERIDYELSVIKQMGFSGYFLITMDFIEKAREMGIPVGPGRGSAAGSMVAYVLWITNLDPLKYGLLFERFLNPERVSMPDIDIDFCYERRDEVIEYVREKYGNENVCQIITFGTMKSRAVIRDVGRVLQIPYGDVDQIAKMIPPNMKLKEANERSQEFNEIVEKDELSGKLYRNASVLEGISRHASTHAAGVVIAPGKLTDYVPLFKAPQGDVTTQYDMKSLENIGLLKMDFLGLRTLTVIEHTLQTLRKKGIEINIDNIPLDDPDTFDVFAKGETVGIFQFESTGMRDYLKKMQPTSIKDLTAMNALYRPGPMDWIDEFIDKKQGRAKVEYLHPFLETILEETHGIIVYQEQVMQIANKLANFSLGKADILRRAMGKKNLELMVEQKAIFIEGAKENDIEAETSSTIFDLIQKFAGYGFNKSHAACYSIVAYQTAYLKAHYPVEFMAANLTSEMGNTDRVVVLVDECKRMNIKILPPDVNTSICEFVPENEGIRFGMGAIKNVGKGAIQSIVEVREKEGKFASLFQLCEEINLRQANRKVMESLIQSGAMDSLEGTRSQKLGVLPKALQFGQNLQNDASKGQSTLFDSDEAVSMHPELPDVPPWSQSEKLRLEKELLGVYLSGHPLLKYKDEVNGLADPAIEGIEETSTGKVVRICGIITEVKTKLDRKDRRMAFFNVEDFTGSVRCIAFADTYENFRELIQEEKMIALQGKVERRGEQDEASILVNDISSLENARGQFAKSLAVNIQSEDVSMDAMERIKTLLMSYPGDCRLYFQVSNTGCDPVLLRAKYLKVNPTTELMNDLRTVLGPENVKMKG